MVTFDELVSGFKKVGLKRGDIVLVHNSFKSFGGVEGGPETVIRSLLKVLGEEGTLIMPTFTFSFCDGFNKTGRGLFDVDETPSEMGVMTEMVRKMPKALRSLNPIYSVAALGARAKELTAVCDKDVFGKRSFFAKLRELDGKIIIIGLNYNRAMTFFHYVEQMEGCNYRHAKDFYGEIKVGKTVRTDTFTMAVRNDGISTDVDRMGEKLEKSGIVKKTTIGQSEIKLLRSQDVYKITAREMKKDPKLLYSEAGEK